MSVRPTSIGAGNAMAIDPAAKAGPNEPPVEELARHLADAVTAAGELALAMRRAGVKSWTKGNSSPVTEADMAADRLLFSRLAGLVPGYGWLSEESADDPARLSARRAWIVDPIDGTRGFMEGSPDWAVSAALVEDGTPLLAALFAPASAELFLATRGAGASRNGMPLAITPRADLRGAAAAGPAGTLDILSRTAELRRLPRTRSLALRIARVATGEIDLALSAAQSNDWDLAAADLIVREAAGRLTTFAGEALRYNAPSPRHPPLVAAGTALHAAALAALHGGEKPFSNPAS